MTPLQKLDDAVREFFTEVGHLDGGRVISSWTLGVGTTRIQAEDPDALPLVDGVFYALGPGTTVVAMSGLARYLTLVADHAMAETLDD